PAARLAEYKLQQRADPIPGSPSFPGPAGGGSAARPKVYCLARLGIAAPLNRYVTNPVLDYCRLPGFSALPKARDSGEFVAFTLGQHNVAVFAPVYRGGIVPSTLALRRA